MGWRSVDGGSGLGHFGRRHLDCNILHSDHGGLHGTMLDGFAGILAEGSARSPY
jgi:hypothetical protein